MESIDYGRLAELLFPDVTETPDDMEKKYPPRELPAEAKVTRFAPSPTGFVHFGGLFPTRVSERLAHQSGGVFISGSKILTRSAKWRALRRIL